MDDSADRVDPAPEDADQSVARVADDGHVEYLPRDAPPIEPPLDPLDKRTVLRERLLTVLANLPNEFRFNNHVAGVDATDLYALNTLLGASIEGEVVKTLNRQRELWDPDDEWLGYTFKRQSQRFPDVLLSRAQAGQAPHIALGIELKGWFVLSKEGEPSYRYTTTAEACAPHDLLCVVPWYLDNVLSGSPVAAEPWVRSAQQAAHMRNHYWQVTRSTSQDRTIWAPPGATPYPNKSDNTSDVPEHDGGGNFGRIARSGMMTDFVAETNAVDALGISLGNWGAFLRSHTDQADPEVVAERVRATARRLSTPRDQQASEALAGAIENLVRTIRHQA